MSDEKGQGRRRLESSRRWLERSRKVIPGCAQTFSKSPIHFVQGVAPNFVARAEGAYVWDVDGNRYIDYILGLGPVILGHGYPAVGDAVRAQLGDGVGFSLPHPIEVEVAELLCELIPCAEMVRFGKNGSDVTAAAVRVARAFTGREKVACSGYHGWQDWYIGSTSRNLGVPECVRQLTLRFTNNDVESLHRLFEEHPNQVGCVVTEVLSFDPPKDHYLQDIKNLCQREGALLIFDEIVTGFRLALGGAQEHYGVTPDLACFGKAMANGFPLAAIVGRADVMRLFEEVFFSFTHGGEALSLAACKATISELQQKDVIGTLWKTGGRLKNETNRLVEEFRLNPYLECTGLPPLSGFRFRDAEGKDSMLLRSLFQQEVLKRGILTHGNHMLSFSHDDTVVEETLQVYADAFGVLADAVGKAEIEKRLEGTPMQPVFRQA